MRFDGSCSNSAEEDKMARYLLASSPVHGHAMPMLAIARSLVGRGHEVRMLTGARFAAPVSAAGALHVPLPPAADYDDRDPDAAFPDRTTKHGLAKLRFDLDNVFINPIPHQADALTGILSDFPADALLTEYAFLGVLPLMLRPRTQRPPILCCGIIPLTLSSRDTAPFGLALAPSATGPGRLRNRALNLLTQRVLFGTNQRHIQRVLHDLDSPQLSMFFLDSIPRLADQFLQLTCASFEYPRSDLPPTVTFVGPILPTSDPSLPLPDWWNELSSGRKVVHVTQGTIDTGDLKRLISPTIQGLSAEDVLVVVSTGGRPVTAVPGPLPHNVRIAAFLPYDRLLPRVDVMVTNGGYGGVQYALANGVPLVVAGATEDKPEVAARVQWAGVGIDLRKGKPQPQAIRKAVRTVLETPGYRQRATRFQAEIGQYKALDAIAAALDHAAQTTTAIQATAPPRTGSSMPVGGRGKIHHSVWIRAEPEDVWRIYVDPSRIPEWQTGSPVIQNVTGPGDKPGTSYTSRRSPGVARTTVIDAEPPRRLVTRTAAYAGLRLDLTSHLKPEREGTRLDLHAETHWPRGLRLLGKVVELAILSRTEGRKELDNLKALIEREANRPAD
jgi:UDP:flavonoid glycosyltransferase YjiC (YdhE family)/uncharacterized protein YndB with AHSA1/START domain